jgi:hypothetical protein
MSNENISIESYEQYARRYDLQHIPAPGYVVI